MKSLRLVRPWLFALGLLMIIPAAASAQSAIAGVVTDATGGVLPGVTVEATSPALIEGARTVFTDATGRYNIRDLRPGVYVVTFSLVGFGTFIRDGIELPAEFTATVNGELRLGSIEESVTVSGQSPVVDLQSAANTQVLPRAVIDAVPSGRSLWAIGQLVPGVTILGQDVGGSRGMQQLGITSFGSDRRDTTVNIDGMITNSFQLNVQTYYNDRMFEEMNYQTSAISAETSGAGVRINMIPKEGGNFFKGSLFYSFSPPSWSGDNIDQELIDAGLIAPGAISYNRDLSGDVGGPVLRDKVWFYFSGRRWGVENATSNSFANKCAVASNFPEECATPSGALINYAKYVPDTNIQVVDDNLLKSGVLRLTALPAPSHKFSAYLDRISKFRGTECGSLNALEACGVRDPRIYYTAQAKYTGTYGSRMLMEFGLSINNESFSTGDRQPERPGIPGGVSATAVRHEDRILDLNWGAPATNSIRFPEELRTWYGAFSYVTGSHAFKAGFQLGRGDETQSIFVGTPGINDAVQRYENFVPSEVVVYNSPSVASVEGVGPGDLGLFVQDTWTRGRLSFSPGLRIDIFNTKYPRQQVAAGRFIAARDFPEQPDDTQPHWKDVSPRLGVVYDVMGDGKTAVKASFGKYMQQYYSTFSRTYNPMTSSTDLRTWTDLNGNDFADGDFTCDEREAWGTPGCEIGRPVNALFGKTVDRKPEDGIKRPYNYETSVSVQREIIPGASLSFAFVRRDYHNPIYTQNIAVQPLGAALTDGYTAHELPSPTTGEMITVYNLKPELSGLVTRLDRNSDNNKRKYNAFDLGFRSRAGAGTIFGGAFWGQQVLVNCDIEDPNYSSTEAVGLEQCDQSQFDMPYRRQLKLSGSYPLPYGFMFSGTLQSSQDGIDGGGEDASQNRLWRINRSTFAALTGGERLTLSSVRARLLPPGESYTDTVTQLDLRVVKEVTVGRYRFEGRLDAFNVLNANPITSWSQNHGSAYQRPSAILLGRVMAVGFTATF